MDLNFLGSTVSVKMVGIGVDTSIKVVTVAVHL
jgi:hypothetical protein